MKVRVLGSRPAPAHLREFTLRTVPQRRPCERVQRRQIPYWQESGWTWTGKGYSGRYQTPRGSFPGFVEERLGRLEFYIHEPPQALKSDSHWVCFQERDKGWYRVHMGKRPADVSTGIMTLERLVSQALRRG
ncbi:MAG: hypothetical protein ABFD89_03215 [Bryobacteraceae bacterium]